MIHRSSNRLRASIIVAIIGFIATTSAVSENKDVSFGASDQSFEDFANQVKGEFINFKDSVKKDYLSFRDSVNREYAEFMRRHWTPTKVERHIDPPVNKEPEPEVLPEEETEKPVIDSRPVKIEHMVEITWPMSQPVPIEPIPYIDEDPENKGDVLQLTFYGTPVNIRKADLSDFRLTGNHENSFADGWETLSKHTTNNLINDCLDARDRLCLPDWGYITLLDTVASRLSGENTNEQRLLQGFLLNQSGYKVRFGYDSERKLHVLLASPGIIYSRPRYYLDKHWYYSYTQPQGKQINICDFKTPGEKAIDLGINTSPLLTFSPANERKVTVERHPDVTLAITPNKNLIDFFNDYPQATPDSSPYSIWAIQGNTPVSHEIRQQLYPYLKQAVEGKSQFESLQFLLKVAQSFPYGNDDEIWGRDRAFWMEESWVYPESDCEDHAINFSRMVRDILDLDVCLVYYPGHMSSCVNVTDENIAGDYIIYDGKKYIVCDPTYFYCNIGQTAPANNNAEAILIPLKK